MAETSQMKKLWIARPYCASCVSIFYYYQHQRTPGPAPTHALHNKEGR